ncbi:TM2 domain-containing protein [Pseudovibrio brasiliensis]|uniref:TM2 domain-containing protein n=1 Tax=Pseudovibrio brasiliensis TaxID=1898042 RepID=A0ABX8AN84_9HYPH|nr:TM2 domain-containing protein [Pseudovibrio brasiliensis]
MGESRSLVFDDIPLPSQRRREGIFNFSEPGKSTAYAILFALLLGQFAAHRFYLRKLGSAIVINCLNITAVLILIPLLLGLEGRDLITSLTTGEWIGFGVAIGMAMIANIWVFVDLIVLIVLLVRESF